MESKGRLALSRGDLTTIDELPSRLEQVFSNQAMRWYSRTVQDNPAVDWAAFKVLCINRFGDNVVSTTRQSELWALRPNSNESALDFADRLLQYNTDNALGAPNPTLKAIFMGGIQEVDAKFRQQQCRLADGTSQKWDHNGVTLALLAKTVHERGFHGRSNNNHGAAVDLNPVLSAIASTNSDLSSKMVALETNHNQLETKLEGMIINTVKKEIATVNRRAAPSTKATAIHYTTDESQMENYLENCDPTDDGEILFLRQDARDRRGFAQRFPPRMSMNSGGQYQAPSAPHPDQRAITAPAPQQSVQYNHNGLSQDARTSQPWTPGYSAQRSATPMFTNTNSGNQTSFGGRTNEFGVPVCNTCGDANHRSHHHCPKCNQVHSTQAPCAPDFAERK